MMNIAVMSTAELASLIGLLREDLERARAAENFVLVQDLRRALANVTAELKMRKPPKSYEVMQKRPATPLLAARSH